jgi:Tol biopolymer transport system component
MGGGDKPGGLDGPGNRAGTGSGNEEDLMGAARGIFPIFGLLVLPMTVGAGGARAAEGDGPATTRVSVASDGMSGNATSNGAAISPGGGVVAFSSLATTLVAGDTNGVEDVFVHDRQTDETTRVSVASDGSQGDGDSFTPSVSADERYVAFASLATNLVPGDSNGVSDVFVHDRESGETNRISVGPGGAQGDADSFSPSISGDGRYVAFESDATTLVARDGNMAQDVFIHDRSLGSTVRVSVGAGGTEGDGNSFGPSISESGLLVAFTSFASNLVTGGSRDAVANVFVHDRRLRTTTQVDRGANGRTAEGSSFSPALSADGRRVAFATAAGLVADDTNGVLDIYVHDRRSNNTTRVSVGSDGSQSSRLSFSPSISADGRYVAFTTDGPLAEGDSNGSEDIFVRDTGTNETRRMSVASDGAQGDGPSFAPSISGDGTVVAFDSLATNLVPGDTNGAEDVFCRAQERGTER